MYFTTHIDSKYGHMYKYHRILSYVCQNSLLLFMLYTTLKFRTKFISLHIQVQYIIDTQKEEIDFSIF
jgi:hypothetical protein